MVGIHDRMPMIVPREDGELWFSPGVIPAISFLCITTPPYPAEETSVEIR